MISDYQIGVPFISEVNLTEKLQRAYEGGASLAEFRLDWYRNTPRIDNSPIPIIATNRHISQGGKAKRHEYRTKQLVSFKADYYDIELNTPETFLQRVAKHARNSGAKLIISHHDFSGVPNNQELDTIYECARAFGADIVKIVGYANREEDNFRILDFAKTLPLGKFVTFCMGEEGKLSRLLAPLYGSSFTFANFEGQSAPGQIKLSFMKEFKDSIMSLQEKITKSSNLPSNSDIRLSP